jgi:signal transduction histidine kinase
MHPNLKHQLQRFFGTTDIQIISSTQEMIRFLNDVELTYQEKDQDQNTIALLLQERWQSEEALKQEKVEQAALIKKLEEAHHQLLQSEKLASIGSLAAGVAHEINNPIGFVASNMGNLGYYIDDLFRLIDAYRAELLTHNTTPKTDNLAKELDLDYLRDGIDRVKQIVQDLKDFSHVDHGEWIVTNLHQGIDSTLNIVSNEIKYKATVHKQYGDIPEICCIGSQLNQVFMNLLVNAAHAIEHHGIITIKTGIVDDGIFVEISDNGCGIPPDHLNRIFDPFFTTKPVGKGTGLGLSLSYGIVKRHQGRIVVDSNVGQGTRFTVWIPIAAAPSEGSSGTNTPTTNTSITSRTTSPIA